VVSAFEGSRVGFTDTTDLEVQNIIWTTGFHMDFSWIHISEALDKHTTYSPKGCEFDPKFIFSWFALAFLSRFGFTRMGGTKCRKIDTLLGSGIRKEWVSIQKH
jgi:hypothetical protein